jgi:nitrogen fixation protein FixH
VIVAGVVLTLAGLVIMWVAIRSWQGRVTRNYVAGVRTPSTMRSDEAFLIANKTAAPFSLVGGALFLITGVVAAVVPMHTAVVVEPTGVALGAVLLVIGAVRGVRAARTTP